MKPEKKKVSQGNRWNNMKMGFDSNARLFTKSYMREMFDSYFIESRCSGANKRAKNAWARVGKNCAEAKMKMELMEDGTLKNCIHMGGLCVPFFQCTTHNSNVKHIASTPNSLYWAALFFQFIYFVRYRTQRFSYEVNFFSPLANQAALARVIGSHMSSFLKLKSNNNLLAISIHLAGLFLCSLTFTLSHSHMLATFQFGNFNGRWRKLWKNTIKIHWWLMFGSNSFSIWNCELR